MSGDFAMQYLPIEFVLESSAIFAGVIFALVALFGIYYYSTDIQYRRWALTHLSFWIAFLPPNVFTGFPYLGDFISMIIKVYACILLLRAFNYRRLSKVPNHIVHPLTFVILGVFWLIIASYSLPSNISAMPTSFIMAIAFFYAAHEILNNTKDRSKIWLGAGISYLVWAVASVPMMFLPIFGEVIVAGYVQFIGQAAVMITMFLAFIGTTRRRIEENLRLTTIFASLLSHDLRNYLNVAQGAIELVEADDSESSEMLETARRSLDSASEFMTHLRGIWIDLGSQSIHIDDLDLCNVLQEVTHRVTKEHSLKAEQITVDCSGKFYVSTTPLISQVLWNIIDNSIRHSKEEPSISVSISSKNSVEISISDRSGGITPQIKKKLLAENGGTNGFGLGLMLVKEITTIYGIPIAIEDRMENGIVVGTTFTISLSHSGGIPTRKAN